MVLRYADVRATARNWQAFTSDAPFRVPIPSEHDLRPVRQLPIETDPPEHTVYRRIIAGPFSGQAAAANRPDVERIARELLEPALARGRLEVVRGFALPLQSRALAVMLGRPQHEAEEWISWGTHVFHDHHDSEEGHASALDRYLERAIHEADRDPGEDFFGLLARARIDGRPLTRDERLGFASVTFAGGRDTVINAIANCVHHLAEHRDDLARLRDDPDLIGPAIEEFLRFFSPLTHIGRIARAETDVLGRTVAADSVVSLCFASANRDESVFDRAAECVIDRTSNRHLAFGFGPHTCIGAPHARMVLSVVLQLIAARVRRMSVVEAKPVSHKLGSLRRRVGFDPLHVALEAL